MRKNKPSKTKPQVSKPKQETPPAPPPPSQTPSSKELERLRAEDFNRRANKVFTTMQEERIDFRGLPFITPDGRIGVRVVPVEARQEPTDGMVPEPEAP